MTEFMYYVLNGLENSLRGISITVYYPLVDFLTKGKWWQWLLSKTTSQNFNNCHS